MSRNHCPMEPQRRNDADRRVGRANRFPGGATVARLSGRPRTSWGLSQFSSDENGTVPLAKLDVVTVRPLTTTMPAGLTDCCRSLGTVPIFAAGRHKNGTVPFCAPDLDTDVSNPRRRSWWLAAGLTFLLFAAPAARAADDVAKFQSLSKQSDQEYRAANYRAMERTANEMMLLAEGPLDGKPLPRAVAMTALALAYQGEDRLVEAEHLHRRALAVFQKSLAADDPNIAMSLNNLANVYFYQARYAEAEPLHKQAIEIREKALGPEHPDVAQSCNNLANVYRALGRYAEAESLHTKALQIREKVLAANHPDVAQSLNNLADLYHDMGRYSEAEPLYRRALAIRKEALGEAHPDVARSLSNLAGLLAEMGRYGEAESLLGESLAILKPGATDRSSAQAAVLYNLAQVYVQKGELAKAEPLLKRSLQILEAAFGRDHLEVARSVNSLAQLYTRQHLDDMAEALYARALRIYERTLGLQHPETLALVNALAVIYLRGHRVERAEQLYRLTLNTLERLLPPDHPRVLVAVQRLAALYMQLGRRSDAVPLLERALAGWEKTQGPNHPAIASDLVSLSIYDLADKQPERAIQRLSRAMQISEQAAASAGELSNCHCFRAEAKWLAGQRSEALDEVKVAMKLAEEQRSCAWGGEHEHALAFGGFGLCFEQMATWAATTHQWNEALGAMERNRAGVLTEQMAASHLDLFAGIPDSELGKLRAREQTARCLITHCTDQLHALEQRTDFRSEECQRRMETLTAELRAARRDYLAVYAEIRSISPAYRLAAAQGHGVTTLAQLQSYVDAQGAILLEYFVGEGAAYVLAVACHSTPRVEALVLTEDQAHSLASIAGPLAAARLQTILNPRDERSILWQLRHNHECVGRAAQAVLAALCQVMIPQPVRAALCEGKYRRLIVVPDVALEKLPFEVLVVRPGENPEYLLDVGPPTVYAPSATVLLNLAQRAAAASPGAAAILTVGGCNYDRKPDAAATAGAGASPAARDYQRVPGALRPLPFTASETHWVREIAAGGGAKVVQLVGDEATEGGVRRQLPEKRIVHLACHGLVDESYGNFFGGIMLTPGNTVGDPYDDGCLTLAETYELNLAGCELAILSACDTNSGPGQSGEGSWTLARGFLVAGARRVLASNWLLDDEAAATTISYFFDRRGAMERQGGAVDYATAIQQAKRSIRRQQKWQSPYYWGTLVLLGPGS